MVKLYHAPISPNFGRVWMVELATINELLPATTPLFPVMLGLPVGEPEKIEQAKQKLSN